MRHHDDDESVPGCDLEQCGCGRLTLRVGRVRLDLSRDELNELHQLLIEATDHLSGATAKLTRH